MNELRWDRAAQLDDGAIAIADTDTGRDGPTGLGWRSKRNEQILQVSGI